MIVSRNRDMIIPFVQVTAFIACDLDGNATNVPQENASKVI